MDVSKIPTRILADIRERGHSDAEVASMSPREAFAEYCNWHGLIGWGGDLWGVVESLNKADS